MCEYGFKCKTKQFFENHSLYFLHETQNVNPSQIFTELENSYKNEERNQLKTTRVRKWLKEEICGTESWSLNKRQDIELRITIKYWPKEKKNKGSFLVGSVENWLKSHHYLNYLWIYDRLDRTSALEGI